MHLDDNQRNAFQYLLGGVVVVVALKVAGFLLGLLGPALPAGQAALHPFQQGYPLLRGRVAVVGTAASLHERLILAVVLAVGAAFLHGLLLVILNKVRQPYISRRNMLAMRITLMVVLGWALYAAVFLPLKETRAVQGAVIITERRPLAGDIPWPWGTVQRRIPGQAIGQVQGGSAHPSRGNNGQAWITLTQEDGTAERIGQVRGLRPEDELRMLAAASEAAAALEREARY